ncbi:MAG: 50S ribosomal protein L7/L12 [Patescibacteria group bacterium]|nr:50S ribosomal protein L7/L12 [Patescibacteria group bacterium]
MVEEKKSISEESKEETKEEKKTEEKKEAKDVEVPAKFKKIVEEIEKMSVLDLSELVKILEEKFDVSAAAPVAVAGGAAAGGEEGGAGEEKSEFDVELVEAGSNKISVIKVVRAVTEKGLKEAKGVVDKAPQVIKEALPKEEAEKLKKELEEAGAKVNLK